MQQTFAIIKETFFEKKLYILSFDQYSLYTVYTLRTISLTSNVVDSVTSMKSHYRSCEGLPWPSLQKYVTHLQVASSSELLSHTVFNQMMGAHQNFWFATFWKSYCGRTPLWQINWYGNIMNAKHIKSPTKGLRKGADIVAYKGLNWF